MRRAIAGVNESLEVSAIKDNGMEKRECEIRIQKGIDGSPSSSVVGGSCRV